MIRKRGQHWHLDVVVNGVRYREALKTTDRREAVGLEKKRVAEIQAGKGASKMGRDFARMPFGAAADKYLEERKPHVAPRTDQLERERLKPLRKFFGEKQVMRIASSDIIAFQNQRRSDGVSGRTVNMEVGVLRRLMTRGKVWSRVGEDIHMDREGLRPIAKVLSPEHKALLFQIAGTREEWQHLHCAAVLAASTTCRSIELKHLRWRDVDLFESVLHVRRSKTESGHRSIPLNSDAMVALARLHERAVALGSSAPEHFVFPSCEGGNIDPTQPQTSWRTAWRSLVKATRRQAAREAGRDALSRSKSLKAAKTAYRRAWAALDGFRFHDLRHQSITELAEAGASDHTLMALAGHMSRRMMEHYSHVRMNAKREAISKLESGLMGERAKASPVTEAIQ